MCFELSPTYFQLTKIAAPTFAISKASIYKFITEISPLNWCKSSFRIYFCVLNKCLHRLAKYSTHECLIMTKPRVESRFFAILPNKQNTKEKIFMCLLFEWLKVGASYSNRCEIRKFGNSDTKHLPMAKSELCASCGGCNELTVHSSHKFQNNSPFIMCRKNILVHCSPLHIHRAASEWVQATINHRLLPYRVKNVQTTKNIAIDLHVSRHLQTKCKREKKINTQQ